MIYFEKTIDTVTVLQGKSAYTIRRHTAPGINLDTWRIYSGDINGVTVWRGTDIEGPIKQAGTTDFIGGCHGDERYKSIAILVDGVQVAENDVVAQRTAENVTIFVTSEVYFCDDTENIAFERRKKLEFRERKLIVSNNWRYVGKGTFRVECFTGCGLYSVYKDLLVGYSTDYDCELINDRGTLQNRNIEKIHFYGKDFVVTLSVLAGKGEYYTGYVENFASETRPRFKGYLLYIGRSKGEYIMNQNDVLNASFEIEIV